MAINGCNTICMLLDNNALEYLHCKASQRERELLKKHYEENRLILHLSPFTFREQIKGVNKSCFGKVQSLFKSAYEFTQGGQFLSEPILHVGYIAETVSHNDLLEDVKMNINLLRELVNAPNYGDWLNIFQEFKDCMERVYREIHLGTFRPTGNISRDKVYIGLLGRYKLEALAATPKGQLKLKGMPSLSYLTTVHHFYYDTVLAKRQAMSGDWIDLEQAVYLNIIDYIMTRDKRYIELLNECGDPELKGRAIKHDVVLKYLKHSPWPKRARDGFSQEYVPLNG